MKKFLKFSLMAFALMFVFGAVALTDAKAQIMVDIQQRMDKHNKLLKSLKANVQMSKYNPQLDVSDISEGKMIYLKTAGRDPFVRIDWTKPTAESLAVINKEYIIYQPGISQAFVGKVDNAKDKAKAGNALSFMNMSRKQLTANYTVRYVAQEKVSGNIETWHLELTPKGKTNYKTAELWVDSNGMPIQAKIVENNNDATTVLLSGLVKNETINGGDFRIKLPENTKIIK